MFDMRAPICLLCLMGSAVLGAPVVDVEEGEEEFPAVDLSSLPPADFARLRAFALQRPDHSGMWFCVGQDRRCQHANAAVPQLISSAQATAT